MAKKDIEIKNDNAEIKNDSAEVIVTKKKKSIIIPVNKQDKDTYVPVVINGVITQIKKGVEVEVDEEVFNLLKDGGYLGTAK